MATGSFVDFLRTLARRKALQHKTAVALARARDLRSAVTVTKLESEDAVYRARALMKELALRRATLTDRSGERRPVSPASAVRHSSHTSPVAVDP